MAERKKQRIEQKVPPRFRSMDMKTIADSVNKGPAPDSRELKHQLAMYEGGGFRRRRR